MLFIAALCSILVIASATTSFVKMESMIPRSTFIKVGRADSSIIHEVLFAIKQRNMDVLESMVLDRSTPGSKNYQKWMTFDEVGNLTSNSEGAQFALDYVAQHSSHIKVTWVSRRKEYIKATAPVDVWEKLFNTEFYSWVDKSPYASYKGNYVLAEEYSLPTELASHVEAVFYTAQTPLVIRKHLSALPKFNAAGFEVDKSKSNEFKTVVVPNARAVKAAAAKADEAQKAGGAGDVVTVAFLNEYYNISSNTGSSDVSQCVFETGESFSQGDLTDFQNDYNLTVQAAVEVDGGDVAKCTFSTCGEGNLDIQYIMGVSQLAVSYWWLVPEGPQNPFLAFVTDLANDADPPLVNSMSYGSIEQDTSASVLSNFNTETTKVAAIGVTVTVSSGDNGVANYGILECNQRDAYTASNCPCQANSGSAASSWTGTGSWAGTGYFPSFPATGPYVTAVGATMGTGGYPPNVGEAEIGCESNIDQVQAGVITSGGGFSTYYPQPSWQKSAVSAWTSSLNTATTPAPGYNKNGRGIPDVAFLGVWYQIVVDGTIQSVFGTSCSSPVFAALVSLVNAARITAGKTSVGYLNPTLYGATETVFNDVTSGFNNCGENNGTAWPCCNSGFYAQVGWDPMTGLGSINYDQLATLLGA